MSLRSLRRWAVLSPLLVTALATLTPACSGAVRGDSGGGSSGGSSGGGSSGGGSSGGGTSSGSSGGGSSDGGTCVTMPALTASDLSCDSDEDCSTVWTGTVCSCGCFCPGAAANTAARARATVVFNSLPPADSTCSDLCQCPALVTARCLGHQCTACGNPASAPLEGQPAGCTEDGGAGD